MRRYTYDEYIKAADRCIALPEELRDAVERIGCGSLERAIELANRGTLPTLRGSRR